MLKKDIIKELEKARQQYEAKLEQILEKVPETEKNYHTFSGLPVKPLYSPLDIENLDFIKDISSCPEFHC